MNGAGSEGGEKEETELNGSQKLHKMGMKERERAALNGTGCCKRGGN